MKRFIKAAIPLAITAAVAYFLLGLILQDILYTIACALVGETYAIIPLVFLIMGVCMAAYLVVHNIVKGRRDDERRDYLEGLGSEIYDRRADGKAVLKNKLFWTEACAFWVVSLCQSTLTFGIVWALLVSPFLGGVFVVYNRFLWLKLHREWADERIRLNPNQEKRE